MSLISNRLKAMMDPEKKKNKYELHPDYIMSRFDQEIKELKFQFIIDDNNIKLLKFLKYYFVQHEKTMTEKYPNYSINKGLFITGKCGTGKTLLMKIFKNIVCQHTGLAFSIKSSNEVVREFDKHGSVALEPFIKRKYLFDDFGSENKGKHYGKDEEVFKTILEERYNQFIDFDLKTHLTSNLTLNQIKERYGQRVYSRIHEMFNIVVLDGNDRRL
jgi:DNA replication protein DnaC